MLAKIKDFFEFESYHTDFRTEVMGGLTTFMTMAYIIIVNPDILSAAGMDKNSVMMATCLASAVSTILMGVFARYPIALAPGMGMNAFFAFEICKGYGAPWPTALGMVFISGVMFLALTFVKFRELLINAIPETLKHAIAAGIGVFIAFIGLHNAGLVVKDDATLVRMGDLAEMKVLISVLAIAATGLMMAARVRGAVLWGIFIAGGMALFMGELKTPANLVFPTLKPFTWQALALLVVFAAVALPLRLKKVKYSILLSIVAALVVGMIAGWVKVGLSAIVAWPPSVAPVAFKLDVPSVFTNFKWLALCLVLLFFALFDTVGTLVGVSEQAGFIKDGKLPRATQALSADAAGTIVGALFGTSTVTCYLESASGVAAGARTGFASVITGLLLLAAIFFSPLVNLLAVGMVTAPALIVVGCLMMQSVSRIKWDDYAEALPAFLTMLLMPLTFSISRGLCAGFISWPLLQLAAGRGRQVHPFVYALAALLLLAVILSYAIM